MSDQQIKSNARDQKKPFFLNKSWPQKSEHQRFLFDIIYRVMTRIRPSEHTRHKLLCNKWVEPIRRSLPH